MNKKNYQRLDMIGRGGSSRVYRVMTQQHEVYALKKVTLDKVDPETLAGYMNEIALLKRLDGNQRIIRLLDSEVKGAGARGQLLLVMECGEIDLARLLQEQQREPMDPVWVAYYWKQVRHCHDVNVQYTLTTLLRCSKLFTSSTRRRSSILTSSPQTSCS